MKRTLASSYCIITCAFMLNAQVIQYEIDPSFNSGLLFNRGGVSDILRNEDGSLVVMGMFSGIDSPITRTGLISPEGQLIFASNFAGFRLTHYLGDYLQYGADLHRFAIPGGGLYDEFKFEFRKPAYSGGLSSWVRDAMVLPDNTILVAGRFFTDSTLIGTSIASQGLRQLCMIDSTGAPVPGFPMLRCAQPVDAEIYSIKKLSTGQYIVSGRFSEIEGHATNSIARLNEDFTVDTTFVSPLVYMRTVIINYVDSQDRMWCFIPWGVLSTSPNDTIWGARILSNGLVDPSFNIPEMFAQVTANQPSNNGTFPTFIGRVHQDSDGTFIITGDFTLYNGVSRKGIAKINDDGSLISGVFDNWGADEAVWGTHTFHPNCGVHPLPDGKLMIGGRFSSFGGEPYSCLLRLQPSGFVGVNTVVSAKNILKIWPNPIGSARQLKLALTSTNEQLLKAELYDMQGRVVQLFHLNQPESQISLHGIVAGMYLVIAWSESGVYTQKLIVEP